MKREILATGAGRNSGVIDLTFVTATACHLCDHAAGVLDELSEEFPLRIRRVELESTEGRAIVGRWGVPFPPVILVDGRLEGFGRISARRLRKVLSAAVLGSAEARR